MVGNRTKKKLIDSDPAFPPEIPDTKLVIPVAEIA
jgi:hypothetical protein